MPSRESSSWITHISGAVTRKPYAAHMGDTEDERGQIVFGLTIPVSVNILLAPVLPQLVNDGWQIHVVCSPGEVRRDLIPDEVSIHHIPMRRSVSPAADAVALIHWIRLLRHIQPGVVVGGTPKAAMLSMVAAWLTGVPVRVFHIRGARWDGMTGAMGVVLRVADRVTARAATHSLAVSSSLADLMVTSRVCRTRPATLGRGGSKGVDTSVFRPRDTAELRGAPLTLGFMGRFAVDKGIQDVVSVFEKCRRALPELRLTMVGMRDPAQPIDSDLEERLRDPVIDRLDFTGTPAEVMRGFDVLVFPSIREGLPNVVIEAGASGVPTVGYDVTGVKDAVLDGVTGFLVPAGDVEGLASVAAQLLRDDGLRERMGRAARNLACQEFARDVVASRFAHWIDQVAMSSRTPGSGSHRRPLTWRRSGSHATPRHSPV